MEIEYNSPEELRKIYFDVTGNDACDCDGEYYQDYCMWLETLHCEGEVYSKDWNTNKMKNLLLKIRIIYLDRAKGNDI